MAISFDQTANGQFATSASPLTWTHTIGVGTDTLLIVGVSVVSQSGFGTPTTSGVTYGGSSMTKAVSKNNISGSFLVETSIWMLVNPPAGAATVSASFSGSSTNYSAVGGSSSYFGAQQSTTPDQTASSSGTATGAQTLNITPVATGCWAFGAFGEGSNPAAAPTAAQTGRWAAATGAGAGNCAGGGEDTNGTVSGATNLGWTISATGIPDWAMCAITFAQGPVLVNVPAAVQGVVIYTP